MTPISRPPVQVLVQRYTPWLTPSVGGPYRGSHGKIAHLEVYQNKAYSGPLLGYYWSSRVPHLGPLFWAYFRPLF